MYRIRKIQIESKRTIEEAKGLTNEILFPKTPEHEITLFVSNNVSNLESLKEPKVKEERQELTQKNCCSIQ